MLEQLGYPTNQVKIYLSALKMGEFNIADIAEEIGMPRTTVTELVREMQRRGIMTYYEKRGKKVWVAENPEKLVTQLEERLSALKNIIPTLKDMRAAGSEGEPSLKFYSGTEEVKNIFNDIAESKQHISVMSTWLDIADFFGQDFMEDFIRSRVKHFLRVKFITQRSKASIAMKAKDSQELRQTRFLPEDIELHRISNYIYGNKVAVVSLNKKVPSGFIIEDADLAQAQRVYFDCLWTKSSDK
ncbi:hypothetical protein KGQ24_01015 [Patescibacteria group bacterium]|nr:hypothetical protein [Patescibacteria group bacterium]